MSGHHPWPPDREFLGGIVTHAEQVEAKNISDAHLAWMTSMWLRNILQEMAPEQREEEMAELTRAVLLECASRYGPS